MKKMLIILAGLIVIISTVYRFNTSENAELANDQSLNNQNMVKAEQAPDIQHLVSYPQKTIVANKDVTQKKVTAIDDSNDISHETPFMQSDTAEKVLKASGKLRENLRGEVYLAIDNSHISSLEAGNTLNLDIPFFDMYQDVEIESTQIDSRGNKTLNASFKMNDDIYTTTITVNDHAIYGHIETPDGIYSLAGNGDYAWMAEAKDLIHGAIPDQIGGNPHDGSADPHQATEQKPIIIKGK